MLRSQRTKQDCGQRVWIQRREVFAGLSHVNNANVLLPGSKGIFCLLPKDGDHWNGLTQKRMQRSTRDLQCYVVKLQGGVPLVTGSIWCEPKKNDLNYIGIPSVKVA